ncbi:hypothetical protein OF83DRAFT_1166078 [Amylostereum chailletii]|nr:hypothetical protein OF83DRAFT_1166078 [Amylostereum chailletii]
MTNQAGPSNQPSRRNLVVCIDGTSNQFGTNVGDVFGNEQLTFYNSGIGTYAEPSWKSLSYLKQVLDHMIDMAIAWNFETIIIVAYLWLSEHYQPGDRIFLFGFSRGAYQVRALAAMMAKVGLIKKGNQAQIPFAYQLYAACGTKDTSKAMAEYFRRVFAREVNIHFIGAWDTVSSVGTVRDKTLPGTTDGMPQACCFRHAMALDERRVKFLPEYAHGGTSLPAVEPVKESDSSTNRNQDQVPLRIHTKEVWFAGTHSDIGGGNVENPAMDRTRPPLRWMAFEAAAEGLHLSTIDRNLTPDEKIDVHESLVWYWWVLEVLPVKRLSYKSKGKDSTWRPHCGVGRLIQPGQRVHSSVILSPAGPQYSSGDGNFAKSGRRGLAEEFWISCHATLSAIHNTRRN